MPELQVITDIVALIFMGVIILVILVLSIIAWRIQRKLKAVQKNVQQKVDWVRDMAFITKRLLAVARKTAFRG